jgi:hypothetical protein
MNNLNYIIFTILFLLGLNLYMGKKTESMTNLDDNQKAEIKQMIYDTYKVDVNAIKNLSEIATKLQKEGLTIPGNLTVTGDIKTTNLTTTGDIKTANVTTSGNLTTLGDIKTTNLTTLGDINIKDTNTKLLKGDGDTLRIQTKSGWINIGAMNNDWCHIYTDRPKFAINKPLTDTGSSPYYEYTKTNTTDSLRNSTDSLATNFNSFKTKFDGFELKPVCIRATSKNGYSTNYIDYNDTCERIGANQIKNYGYNLSAWTALLPVKEKLNN